MSSKEIVESHFGDLIEKVPKLGLRKILSQIVKEHAETVQMSVSILLLITCNLNHCGALYRLSNKSYDENKTNFWENYRY